MTSTLFVMIIFSPLTIYPYNKTDVDFLKILTTLCKLKILIHALHTNRTYRMCYCLVSINKCGAHMSKWTALVRLI